MDGGIMIVIDGNESLGVLKVLTLVVHLAVIRIFQMIMNPHFGFFGQGIGCLVFLIFFILARGFYKFTQALELCGKMSADAAHREVHTQADFLRGAQWAIHLRGAELACASARQTENIEEGANQDVY